MADDVDPARADTLWYKDAVIYQLHVKSFYDSNNDGIGDFAGLIAKLDYIASLGVNTIWLLPFYPSPRRDDGYDIADYTDVSPDLGTLKDARRFIGEAHARGMRVITELVINHTSDQHPWFQRARHAKPGSNHRDFYVWSDSDAKYPETRIIFLDTEKSNWTYDPVAGAYFWHRFYSHQPDLNFDNPKVLKAILKVMHFWLDLGVDGLRLDAIPYLVEREGTNNENLPETHAVLKAIRAELDAHYPDRMLLAEANQWPEDTQEYFGAGDECHMAFHFPLMPRMYMAIAKEDRFPITDIMRQTPAIPDNCQWAIFLRNHDELTLEMVTDDERDYLWNVYAADRRARINLGIRRRLAPLLERDRRRIELMNALLLSMPGTPVIYYGDELGMGDNIHLGDRDGVRTPMQWSPDRNGGFSRADPADLVLPPIMDPLYGFDAVNVEAQGRDPHSLLNWMRRMLRLRSDRKAFGRGRLQFIYPENRKILAYLREVEGETILCVYNLSRTPQAVELDLSAFEGRGLVEMTGGSAFPPIGRLPYLLTLPPFGFFWFELMPASAGSAWRAQPPEMLPEFTTLVLRKSVTELSEPVHRKALEGEILPAYLPRRRWFAGSRATLEGARFAFAAQMPGAPEMAIAEIEATVAGETACYVLPLTVAWEEARPSALAMQLGLARVRRGRRVGVITDAITSEAFAHAVLAAFADRAVGKSTSGAIRFLPTERFADLVVTPDAPIRWLSPEQPTSTVAIGDGAVLKILRHVTGEPNPKIDMARHLTAADYANAAPLLGEVVRESADGGTHALMILEGHIRNQGNAFDWFTESVKRLLDEAPLSDEDPRPTDDPFGETRAFARRIGLRVGEFHAVLARPSDDPAFAVAPADADTTTRWATDAIASVDAAIDALARRAESFDDDGRARFDRLRQAAPALGDALRRLGDSAKGTPIGPLHGDLHLGRLLVSQGDASIVGFGTTVAPGASPRPGRTSPLYDVACLIRSLEQVTEDIRASDHGDAVSAHRVRREDLLDRFLRDATAALLDGHRDGVGEASAPDGTALLPLFLIGRAADAILAGQTDRPLVNLDRHVERLLASR